MSARELVTAEARICAAKIDYPTASEEPGANREHGENLKQNDWER